MLLKLSLEPHFWVVSNNEIEKNVNVHWKELLKAKMYIYVNREQRTAYFQCRSTSAGNESVNLV